MTVPATMLASNTWGRKTLQPCDPFDDHLDHRYFQRRPHAERLARLHVFRDNGGQRRRDADIGLASDDKPALLCESL